MKTFYSITPQGIIDPTKFIAMSADKVQRILDDYWKAIACRTMVQDGLIKTDSSNHILTLPISYTPAIDMVEPDAPAPTGDPWPCHVFWAPMPEPLGAVLRPDTSAPAAKPRPGRLARIWAAHHEWITVAVIIFAALVVTLAQN